MKILVTGAAGFIGMHTCERLLARGDEVIGLDSINDYYDLSVKYGRLEFAGINKDDVHYNKIVSSTKFKNYKFIQLKLEDKENLDNLFKTEKFDKVQ